MKRYSIVLIALIILLAACQTANSPAPSVAPSSTAIGSTTATPTLSDQDTFFAQERETMVVKGIEARGVQDTAVLHAMRTVPRHLFVPDDYQDLAYADRPLPIGYGQTISQPYIVALMTELLNLQKGDKVLEIGTGSGYQAAVLAEIPGVEVYTIEIVTELAQAAQIRLDRLGYTAVHCMHADGYYGWPEHAPFDGIIVTAAPDHVPHHLVDQLAVGGHMVIPIGPPGSYQTLWQFVKQADGELKAYNKGGVVFVPFTGQGIESDGPPQEQKDPPP